MIERAAVIGDGAMGTVCAALLATNGLTVRLWGRSAERAAHINAHRVNERYVPGMVLNALITAGADMSWALQDAEVVVSAIPCQHTRRVWSSWPHRLASTVPIVSVTKGIEIDTLMRPSEVLNSACGDGAVALLSGPSIAHEVARGLPATVVAACDDSTVAGVVQSVFSTDTFRVYTNSDLLGVELAAAMKNVIAIAAGVLDGLALGDNAKASLITRGLVEIVRLGVAMGARVETFAGLAGVGDLVTTCISPYGRNRTAGQHIGEGMAVPDVVAATPSVIEGIPTTQSVMALAQRYGVDMPITAAVGSVLFDGVAPAAALHGLMTRELKPE
jgi:glycerol-3-phosphate dehydrogenase (NAD(P)+)